MSGFTKEIIAKTFTELLDEKPMSKITVKDIVERCGVNRNTFYYHFKDIPDVVEFILKKKWDEILEHPQDRASILECMEEMADLVRNNRKVMFNVYRSVKKDTFLFYMNEISNYIIMEYFRKNADQFDLDEGEIRILIQYYKCLFMGFLMEWLDNNLKSDLGELAQLPVSVFLDNIHKMTVSVQGTNGKWVEESRILNMGFGHNHYIKFYYGADNLEIKEIVLTPNR